MVAAQRQQGVDAVIVSTNDDGQGVLTNLPLCEWTFVQGVPVLLFPRWNPPLRPLREFAIAPLLVRWLLRHGSYYDLLHVHALFSFPSTAAMAVARQLQMPYILRSIGQLQRWSLQQSAGRKRLMLRLIERRNLQGASRLHFTSLAEQQEASDLNLGVSSFVLPLGVELSSAQPRASKSAAAVQLLFLSRLHPKKQLPLLLDALANLRRRRTDCHFHLHIAGDGDPTYVRSLRDQARQLGLTPWLSWHGFVAGAAKTALFEQADWFVLPSAAENFGIAVAEALAHSLPVLLAPGVALADAVVEAQAGYCVPPSVDAWSAALEHYAFCPPAAALRQAAHQLAAERFSWPSITTRLLDHYHDVVQGC